MHKVTTKRHDEHPWYYYVLCTEPHCYNIWLQRNITHIWEKVNEQQHSRGCAAWRSRLQDRGCCCSLTDETGKSSGHIPMLIDKGLGSRQIAFGPYVNLEAVAHTQTEMCTLKKGPNFKSVRFLISCKVSKPASPNLWWWMTIHSLKIGILSKKWGNWVIFQKAIEQKEVSSWQDGRSDNPQPRTSAAFAIIVTASAGLYKNMSSLQTWDRHTLVAFLIAYNRHIIGI